MTVMATTYVVEAGLVELGPMEAAWPPGRITNGVLETRIVRDEAAKGRLPIAIIAHGNPGGSKNDRDGYHSDNSWLMKMARVMANRGYLSVIPMRRGYGYSSERVRGLHCWPNRGRKVSYAEFFSDDAADLRRLIEILGQRPDADPNHIVAIGASAGGAAAVAYGAYPSAGLRLVVSLAGGFKTRCSDDSEQLTLAYAQFGQLSNVPSLWIYAGNDSIFPPDVVDAMHRAYTDSGAPVRLIQYGPYPNIDGHQIFGYEPERSLRHLDVALKAIGLPHLDNSQETMTFPNEPRPPKTAVPLIAQSLFGLSSTFGSPPEPSSSEPSFQPSP
jgi:dienelactone hydrolase